MATYTRLSPNPLALLRDGLALYRIRTRFEEQAAGAVELARGVAARFAAATGERLAGKRVLVVGFGQTLHEAYCLGVANEVVGIDLDLPIRGLHPLDYLRAARRNGAARAVKTLVRKALGIDVRWRAALRRELGVPQLPSPTLLEMDAERMSFADGGFDLVYSASVFEHLPRPDRVLPECRRVLAPGGVLLVSTHVYTAEDGCHDLRIFAGQREHIPFWAHLRPAHRSAVVESCYLNRWRMSQWEALFRATLPGVALEHDRHHAALDAQLRRELPRIRAGGELGEYADEELLAVNLVATWRKPGRRASDGDRWLPPDA
jgi:SAM-dependent methyltransferase